MVPQDAERRGGEGLRTVVVGEVISIRSLGRVRELREHRARMRRPSAQVREPATDAKRSNSGPPPPPPESTLVPRAPPYIDGLLQVEVYVLESIKGEDPEIIVVPAGGPCGQVPRVGQQVVVMVEQAGPAHLVLGRAGAPFADLDSAWLGRLRACMQAPCGE